MKSTNRFPTDFVSAIPRTSSATIAIDELFKAIMGQHNEPVSARPVPTATSSSSLRHAA